MTSWFHKTKYEGAKYDDVLKRKPLYVVAVGNVESIFYTSADHVYKGPSKAEAEAYFLRYEKLSKSGQGQEDNKTVILYELPHGGASHQVIREFNPPLVRRSR